MLRIYDALVAALGLCAGLVFFLMAIGISCDVFLKLLSLRGLNWLADLVEYGMYVATFLAAPWVLRLGGHVRVDFLLTNISPGVAAVIELLANLVGIILCMLLAYFAAKALGISYSRGDLLLKNLIFPEWWLMAVMPGSFALMAVEFALRLTRQRSSEEKLSL
jgi:TRAP-type transport system small permease protein